MFSESQPAEFALPEETPENVATKTQNTSLVYMMTIHLPTTCKTKYLLNRKMNNEQPFYGPLIQNNPGELAISQRRLSGTTTGFLLLLFY